MVIICKSSMVAVRPVMLYKFDYWAVKNNISKK